MLDKIKEIDGLLTAKDKEGIIVVVKSWPDFLKVIISYELALLLLLLLSSSSACV